MDNQIFALVLKKLRLEKKLSQEEFGFQTGLHRTYVSQLERGLKSPSLNTLSKIAKVLDIKLSHLFYLMEEEANDYSE